MGEKEKLIEYLIDIGRIDRVDLNNPNVINLVNYMYKDFMSNIINKTYSKREAHQKYIKLFTIGKLQTLLDEINVSLNLDNIEDNADIIRSKANLYLTQFQEIESDAIDGQARSAETYEIELNKSEPNFQYRTQRDNKVRQEHFELDGVTRAKTDSFWDTFTPPIGYNCFDKETEVYTNNGFKLFKDLNENDKVLTLDPISKNIEYQKPISYYEGYSEKMIQVKGQNLDMLMTHNHQVLVNKDWDRRMKRDTLVFRDASDLRYGDRVYRSSEWVGEEKDIINVNGYTMDVDSYVKLMGWYLSEGNVSKRGDDSYYIKISQSKNKYYEEVYENLSNIGVKLHRGCEYISFNNTKIGKYLKQFGYSYEKYIPNELKELPKDKLKMFLHTAILGDGSIRDNHYQYYTSSKRLRDDIAEIAIKCGYSVNINLHSEKGIGTQHRNGYYYSNHDVYSVYISNHLYSVIKPEYVSEVDYNDKVYCCEVEKYNTLLIKRNNKVYWSGNCRCYLISSDNDQTRIPDIEVDEARKGRRVRKTDWVNVYNKVIDNSSLAFNAAKEDYILPPDHTYIKNVTKEFFDKIKDKIDEI